VKGQEGRGDLPKGRKKLPFNQQVPKRQKRKRIEGELGKTRSREKSTKARKKAGIIKWKGREGKNLFFRGRHPGGAIGGSKRPRETETRGGGSKGSDEVGIEDNREASGN